MKKLTITAIAFICAFCAMSREDKVYGNGLLGKFLVNTAVEYGNGISFPIKSVANSSIRPACSLNASLLYSFAEKPWDLGAFVLVDRARHKFEGLGLEKRRSILFGLNTTYNFRKYNKINPFITLGFGPSINALKEDGQYIHKTWHPAAEVRCGVELWNAKLYAYSQFSQKSYNTAGLSLSIMFGPAHHAIKSSTDQD